MNKKKINSQIENITRDIIQINKFKIKIQINNGIKDKNNNRKESILIREYISNKYNSEKLLSSINIISNVFLVFEINNKLDDKNFKSSIYFSYPHLFKLKEILTKARNWFYNKKFEDLYLEKNNRLYLNEKKYGKLKLRQSKLPNLSILEIYPDIIEINNETYEAIVFYFCKENSYVLLTIDEFNTIYNIIMNLDLFLYSQSLINFSLILNTNLNNINIDSEELEKNKNLIYKIDKNIKRKKIYKQKD